MHSVAQFVIWQSRIACRAFSPCGNWLKQFWMHALSAQAAAHMLKPAHCASLAQALISLQHLDLRHVVHMSSLAMAGQLPGGPPPAPPVPVPVPVVVVPVAVVAVGPPPEPVVAPVDPPFPPSSDPPAPLEEP